MQVAVVSRDPPVRTERTGTRRLGRLASALGDRGHEVVVYCVGWWDEEASGRRIEFDGLRYEGVTFERSRLFYSRLPGLMARHRPDVIVASPTPPATAVAAAIGGTVARAPVVCDWYGDEPFETGRWLGPAARLPTRVVAPSELHRTRVRELGAGESETVVVPQSIDFSLVESTPPADRREVVFASRLDGDANLESLLLALAELRGREDWSATVIGDGPDRADYESQADHLSITDRVEFVGDLDREARVARYRGAHAFVQTGRRVHFAEELLWALAAGCVGVVEYQVDSSAHELVERRPRGIRVTDMEALDDAIEDAWTLPYRDLDEDFRTFDHTAVTERYLELFRDCGVNVDVDVET